MRMQSSWVSPPRMLSRSGRTLPTDSFAHNTIWASRRCTRGGVVGDLVGTDVDVEGSQPTA